MSFFKTKTVKGIGAAIFILALVSCAKVKSGGSGSGLGDGGGASDSGGGAFVFSASNLSSFFDSASFPAATGANSDVIIHSVVTKFTLSLWVKAGTIDNGDCLYQIYDPTGGGGTNKRHLRIYWKNGSTLRAQLYDGGTVPLETTAITPGNWNHIVYTWDVACTSCVSGDQPLRLYVNGVRVAQANLNAGSLDFDLDSGGKVEVGACENANHAQAHIDDVAFWESDLSTAAIVDLYNGGKPTDYRSDFGNYSASASLKNFWWMGDGSTLPTITDVVGGKDLTTQNVSFASEAP